MNVYKSISGENDLVFVIMIVSGSFYGAGAAPGPGADLFVLAVPGVEVKDIIS